MNVSVVTSEVTISANGKLPERLLELLNELYGDAVSISGEDAPYADSKWFNELHHSLTPGDVVRTYRTLAKLTQTQLGGMVGGKSRKFISEIENGQRDISEETARALAAALKRPFERFIGSSSGDEAFLTLDELDSIIMSE